MTGVCEVSVCDGDVCEWVMVLSVFLVQNYCVRHNR